MAPRIGTRGPSVNSRAPCLIIVDTYRCLVSPRSPSPGDTVPGRPGLPACLNVQRRLRRPSSRAPVEPQTSDRSWLSVAAAKVSWPRSGRSCCTARRPQHLSPRPLGCRFSSNARDQATGASAACCSDRWAATPATLTPRGSTAVPCVRSAGTPRSAACPEPGARGALRRSIWNTSCFRRGPNVLRLASGGWKGRSWLGLL